VTPHVLVTPDVLSVWRQYLSAIPLVAAAMMYYLSTVGGAG
jgi:hypothetical protein